ncbi:MAG: SLC13 family permease [Bacteroidetes bacterium]|nr:MAG: SLC13 family permease [Bacteroidota bacterium]
MLDQYILYLVLVFILISLYFNLIGPAFTFVIAVVVLGISGILTPREILGGFANEQIIIIIILLLIGDIIRKKGVLNVFFEKWIFNGSKSYPNFMARMTFMIAGSSAFLNNTPLVAVMMPYVSSWGKKHQIAASKLLIPLSYAAILGGTATLIGTSTNLIVNGMVADQILFPNFKSLGIFDFAWVGIPMTILGIIYLLIFANKLLPNNEDSLEKVVSNRREYLVDIRIAPDSEYVGKSVEKGSLRNLKSLFLVEVRRGEKQFSPISPYFILEGNDILTFAGNTQAIAELIEPESGLTPVEVGMFKNKAKTQLIEIVISYNSNLLKKTVKDAHFRSRFDAAVIAIHRNGERLNGKLGQIILEAGDVLLLLAGEDFANLSNYTRDFYPLSTLRTYVKPKTIDAIVLIGGLISAIILSALNIIPLFMGVVGLLVIILALGIANPKDIQSGIDFDLGLIIALSLALGTAMIKTGVAYDLAHGVIGLFRPFGTLGLLIGIYLVTAVLAAYITNKAAVALMFPIVLTIALAEGMSPTPFVLLIAYAAAANFITPIGYQTNLMVYGPGGYRFRDFMKIGLPLTILYMIGAVSILFWRYF